MKKDLVIWYEKLTGKDVSLVGGKNASLGEMIHALSEKEVRVPGGFATTTTAYWLFLEKNELHERISEELKNLSDKSLEKAGKAIRKHFKQAEMPEEIIAAVSKYYEEFGDRIGQENPAVAVRSSATAEDLKDASFAGQQESFLNISGKDALIEAVQSCFTSLFTNRAIAYREEHNYEHLKVAISVGIQQMINADTGGAGVMFTIDTETGFPGVIVINAAFGLGENVVKGAINPDEYRVFKPLLKNEKLSPIIASTCGTKEKMLVFSKGKGKTTINKDTPKKKRKTFVLSDKEILTLARCAVVIEEHYGYPMDIEWVKDGKTQELYIVQARPETVQTQKNSKAITTFSLKEDGDVLLEGQAVGAAIATGQVSVVKSIKDKHKFKDGSILVTDMTDPDWLPLMKRAAAIVTNQGGRTSHAAIVSRELGLPGVIGAGEATDLLSNGQEVTVSCSEGERGYVYDGYLKFEKTEIDPDEFPDVSVRIMLNIATPAAAFRWWQLPVNGIGLARMEFIINNAIKIHPLALLHSEELDTKEQKQVKKLISDYKNGSEYFIDRLSRNIAAIAASRYPDEVIVRLSDFKSNEYKELIGGKTFESDEENPMLGFRGASRYYSEEFRVAFDLECKAILKARNEIGLSNISLMIPFVRTPEEADKVIKILNEHELVRGKDGLKIFVMCEIPSNVFLASEFADRFDGFSIGSNDLTQLVLGVDRDSHKISSLFDEQHPAVKKAITEVIKVAHENNCTVGICGQAPGDYPEFARFLVDAGIDSISLSPDSVMKVLKRLTE